MSARVGGRWTWRTAWRRVRQVAQAQGLRGVWFAILAATVYRRVLLMERLLDEPIPEIPTPPSTAVRLLEPGDVGAYLRLRNDADAVTVHRRLAEGHKCFVVSRDARIVHAGWAAAERAAIEFLGTAVDLDEDEVYQYDSYTAPEFRGGNLAALRVTTMARELRRLGYRRLIAAVVPENRPAFRPLEKAGYRVCGSIGVVRLLGWRRIVRRRVRRCAP